MLVGVGVGVYVTDGVGLLQEHRMHIDTTSIINRFNDLPGMFIF